MVFLDMLFIKHIQGVIKSLVLDLFIKEGIYFMIFGFEPLEGGYEVPMRVVGANIPYEWLIYIIMFIPIGISLLVFQKSSGMDAG